MAEVVFSVTADSVSKTRIDISTGRHVFSVDEPERLGGTDAGPNPLEYMLGALAGCLNVTGHLVAREMGFEIESMSIQLEGKLDPLVFMGKKKGMRAGFKEIHARMDVDSSASEETLGEWAKAVEVRCPVSDNLIGPTPVRITLQQSVPRVEVDRSVW